MKTSLTLSAVLFALTLSPAAFANGAQEQTQDVPKHEASRATLVQRSTPAPAAVTRSVLERFDVDVRADLIGSLRESAMLVLQLAAPALADAASASAGKPTLTAL